MSRRRLLVVTSQARTVHSGVGTYAATLLDGLEARRPEFSRISVATWRSELDRRRWPRFEWIDLGLRPGWDPTPGCFWTLGHRLLRGVRGRELDLVHFLDAREAHALVRSARRGGAELIGTVHDDYAARISWKPWQLLGKAADPWRRYLFYRWQKRLERRTYRRLDLVMVNSRATGDVVRQAFGLDPGRLAPITLTVPPAPAGVAAATLPGTPSLLFAGGNFYRKGLDVCVRALASLRDELPGIRLHVAGECRSAPRILGLVQELGVQDLVEFHGRVGPERMTAMFAGAGMFVMPSRTEALGLVYLEAFRAGIPVIAGDRGGVTEIVFDRKSGLLVTPGSPHALAEAVRMLARDPALRRQLVAGGTEILSMRRPERLLHETFAVYGVDPAEGVDGEPAREAVAGALVPSEA